MAENEKQQQASSGETVEAGQSLLDQVIQTTKFKPGDESYTIAKRGLEAFIRELTRPEQAGARVHPSGINHMIAELGKRMSEQVDQNLHHSEVQKLQSPLR